MQVADTGMTPFVVFNKNKCSYSCASRADHLLCKSPSKTMFVQIYSSYMIK
ncbi:MULTISPECIES: hypothetical protein [unclassified Wolbachia]|uniref:hypothetical protein n=1 Tax=unclassified Wolbachia TaxID=2640676 RepID=UPI0022329E75|nr:hypothetical protein [Wolbachia endosymbiont (group A) of Apoderus coryli]